MTVNCSKGVSQFVYEDVHGSFLTLPSVTLNVTLRFSWEVLHDFDATSMAKLAD